jgi:hypothetical protein
VALNCGCAADVCVLHIKAQLVGQGVGLGCASQSGGCDQGGCDNTVHVVFLYIQVCVCAALCVLPLADEKQMGVSAKDLKSQGIHRVLTKTCP